MILDWLFPDVAIARKSALATIDRLRREMDTIHELERPLRELCREVLPLLRDLELSGVRPTKITVPHKRLREIGMAHAEAEAIRGRLTPLSLSGTLFGVPFEGGERLEVT